MFNLHMKGMNVIKKGKNQYLHTCTVIDKKVTLQANVR